MKKKNLIIIIVCLLVAVAGIVTANILIKPKEEKTPTENKVDVIKKTSVLETADSAASAELIKENIVKITNEVKGVKVTGTGFFHESGYLVTNSHVVDLKGTIKITYNDGTETEATLVSNDMTSDIAILSVEEQKVLALTFGNTLNLKVTDELYAIGYPLALEGEATTTKGILSARRSAGGIEYLQTDMSLNTGNSGGPLINDKAEVFGMTTYATENASLGMSISAESLESIIQKLIDKKETKYLEDDRETNALSTVLKEIGHKDEDIYDEKERLDEVFEREQPKEDAKEEKEETKQETKPVVKKSGDNTIKKLTINGKVYKVDKEDNCMIPYNVRQQSLEPLDIQVIPNHAKATVKITGNKYVEAGKSNIVNITVTAENGEQFVYDIKIYTTKPTLERLAKVIVIPSSTYDKNTEDYYLDFSFIEGRDKENGFIDDSGDPFTKMHITLYANKRELKTYSFDLLTSTPKIRFSEIRSMIAEEEYTTMINDELNVELTMKIVVDTVEQGSFTYNEAYYWLSK